MLGCVIVTAYRDNSAEPQTAQAKGNESGTRSHRWSQAARGRAETAQAARRAWQLLSAVKRQPSHLRSIKRKVPPCRHRPSPSRRCAVFPLSRDAAAWLRQHHGLGRALPAARAPHASAEKFSRSVRLVTTLAAGRSAGKRPHEAPPATKAAHAASHLRDPSARRRLLACSSDSAGPARAYPRAYATPGGAGLAQPPIPAG